MAPSHDPPFRPTTTNSKVRQRSYISSFIRWLQIKNYQYEVTFSLYMLTRTEKIIFNIIIVTLFSLLVIATSLYLPEHIKVIYNRIWYYVHGEKLWTSNANGSAVADSVKTTLCHLGKQTKTIVAETVESVFRTLDEL